MRRQTTLARLALLSAAILGLLAAPPSHGQSPRGAGSKGPAKSSDALASAIRGDITRALDQLQAGGDFAAGIASLQTSFDQVVAYAASSDKKLFRDAACVLRLAALVSQVEAAQ